jgi:hypothetical protein
VSFDHKAGRSLPRTAWRDFANVDVDQEQTVLGKDSMPSSARRPNYKNLENDQTTDSMAWYFERVGLLLLKGLIRVPNPYAHVSDNGYLFGWIGAYAGSAGGTFHLANLQAIAS